MSFKRVVALLTMGILLFSFTGCKKEQTESALADEFIGAQTGEEVFGEKEEEKQEEAETPKEEKTEQTPEVSAPEKEELQKPEQQEPAQPETKPEVKPEVQPETNPDPMPEQTPDSEMEEPARQGGPLYTAEENPYKESLKILAIGNSFSSDGVEFLWDIANSMGIREVVIGNMYIGGCSLDTHFTNMKSDLAAYRYYKNTQGKWQTQEEVAISTALKDEKWDIITLQQVSEANSNKDSYKNLQNILRYIEQKKPKKDTKFLWHMTWAYQADCNRKALRDYGNDQIKMYEGVLDRIQNDVLIYEDFVGVIPVGTAIQNLRTTPIGDTLTRDGYHLSKGVGRFIAALTWYCYITGAEPREVPFTPAVDTTQIMTHYENICKSVAEAIKTPYEVMQ